jgi:DNA-binding NtrC family response regulator
MRLASTRFHVPLPRLRRQVVARAQEDDWPGNVRELQNVVERAVIVAHGDAATLDLPGTRSTVPAPAPPVVPPGVVPEEEWRRRERANVLAALRQAAFRVSGRGGAAELLGVNPRTLASRLKALGLDGRRLKDQRGNLGLGS